jgi:hypothetical protein
MRKGKPLAHIALTLHFDRPYRRQPSRVQGPLLDVSGLEPEVARHGASRLIGGQAKFEGGRPSLPGHGDRLYPALPQALPALPEGRYSVVKRLKGRSQRPEHQPKGFR